MRWLTAREWLEHERLTGLPHADLAGEALGMLDELEGYQEAGDLRWWAVWDVLVDAGVVDRNQKCAEVDVPALLRMFLPAG